MPKLERRTQAERRETAETRMLEFALKLVAERGYEGFSLADVAEAAGYSRGLPAHYFQKKEVLLSRVAEYTVESYHQELSQMPKTERGLPCIEAMIRHYVRAKGVAIRALQVLMAQALVVPELRRTMVRLNAQSLAAVEAEIRAGIKLGNIRRDIDILNHASVIYSFLRGQLSFASLDPGFDQVAAGEEFAETVRARLAPIKR